MNQSLNLDMNSTTAVMTKGQTLPNLERLTPSSHHDSDLSFGYDSDYENVSQMKTTCTLDSSSSPMNIVVKGIYTKQKLQKDVDEKSLSKEQFMCRRRIRTKPMIDGRDDYNDKEKQNEYETAHFRPGVGLAPLFWHSTQVEMGYRAILFQSTEHYQYLRDSSQFKDHFTDMNYMETPSFGEQVIVQGCDATQISIGDVFAVQGGPDVSPLVVEITSPRKPCYYVNKRHGTVMGAKGIQRHCLTNGWAGWFASVLVEGELRDGMTLVRTQHPNPKWTLSYISKTLYGDANRMKYVMCKAHWSGDKCELDELVRLPQLGDFEWREDAVELLKKLEEEQKDGESSTKLTGDQRSMEAHLHGNNYTVFTIPRIIKICWGLGLGLTLIITFIGAFKFYLV